MKEIILVYLLLIYLNTRYKIFSLKLTDFKRVCYVLCCNVNDYMQIIILFVIFYNNNYLRHLFILVFLRLKYIEIIFLFNDK